ncbi:hypothetical protein LINPERHAP1_LOCUS24953, partial [Linum perenne]
PNLISYPAAVIFKFWNIASFSYSNIIDVERIMHKLKKQEQDWFMYDGGEINCWCDLRATRSIAISNLERYFGFPREEVKRFPHS